MNKTQLTEIAVNSIKSSEDFIVEKLAVLDSGNVAVLVIWKLLIDKYESFVKETGVDKTKSWDMYFKPYLEKAYPKRGWGLKTMQSYRRVNADAKKTREYLAGEFELSSGRKKTVAKLSDEAKLAKVVTTFNNLVEGIVKAGKKVTAISDSKGLLTVEVK